MEQILGDGQLGGVRPSPPPPPPGYGPGLHSLAGVDPYRPDLRQTLSKQLYQCNLAPRSVPMVLDEQLGVHASPGLTHAEFPEGGGVTMSSQRSVDFPNRQAPKRNNLVQRWWTQISYMVKSNEIFPKIKKVTCPPWLHPVKIWL